MPATPRPAEDLRSIHSRLCFVEVDLQTQDLGHPLLQAGYRNDQPTAWVCEGVTAYLDVGSIARLWRSAAAPSADGSRFAVSYITPTKGRSAATATVTVTASDAVAGTDSEAVTGTVAETVAVTVAASVLALVLA